MEVKDIIPNLNRAVLYGGSEYKLTASIIRKDAQGRIFYQAEIQDKNKNSVCITKLEDVKCLETI
jgi:hypothetical protein